MMRVTGPPKSASGPPESPAQVAASRLAGRVAHTVPHGLPSARRPRRQSRSPITLTGPVSSAVDPPSLRPQPATQPARTRRGSKAAGLISAAGSPDGAPRRRSARARAYRSGRYPG